MIDVIGSDAGAPDSLPGAQQELLRRANWIAAPDRLLPALRHWLQSGVDHQAWGGELHRSDAPIALCDALSALPSSQCAVVLASGDPLWFGIGRILSERLPQNHLRFHPAPSSLQLAFARLGRSWQDAEWLSLHGRDPTPLMQRLQQRPEALAILTDPSRGGVDEIRQSLLSSGLEAAYSLWLFESLGHSNERVQRLESSQATPQDLHSLHLVVLLAEAEEASRLPPLPLFGLDDGIFLQHNDRPGLMTKREVRIQLLAELNLPQQGVLWDLGAGTGSVGLEALRLQPELQLLCVEQRSGGRALIAANALRLGVHPAAIVEGNALEALEQLPAALATPDRVLIGGGGRQRRSLLEQVMKRMGSHSEVVIPLATLEALADLRPILESAHYKVKVSQHQAWRGQPLGEGTRLAPMNPVLILKGSAPHNEGNEQGQNQTLRN